MTAAVPEPTEATRPRLATSAPGIAIVVVTVAWAFAVGRHLWFFSDDWNIIASYHSGNQLEPFNSHLSLVPVGIYQVLFHTVGLDSYVPFRVVGLAAYAVLGWVTWRFALSRLGTTTAGIAGAALATAAVLWNSGGVTNVMFPFLMNFSLPVAALAAIWWHLDRSTTRDDVAASVWLVVALATSGLGLMTAVAVGVELVWVAVQERRVDWKRWAIVAPGPVLWLAWYVAYGVDSPASGGLRPVISYAARMMLGGFASLTGGIKALGVVAAALTAALIMLSIARRKVDGRIVGAFAAPLAFSVLTAISRIGVVPAIPPDELRYRWTIGAFLVFAIVLMLAANADLELSWRRLGIQVLLGVSAVAVVANAVVLIGDIGDWNHTVELAAPGVRTNLWAAETAAEAGRLDDSRRLPVSYVPVTAGEYMEAIGDLGSPIGTFGDDPDDFREASLDSRRTADEALIHDFALQLAPDQTAPGETCGDSRVAQGNIVSADAELRSGARLRMTAGDADVVVKVAITSPVVTATDIGTIPSGESRFIGDLAPDDHHDFVTKLVFSAPTTAQDCQGTDG